MQLRPSAVTSVITTEHGGPYLPRPPRPVQPRRGRIYSYRVSWAVKGGIVAAAWRRRIPVCRFLTELYQASERSELADVASAVQLELDDWPGDWDDPWTFPDPEGAPHEDDDDFLREPLEDDQEQEARRLLRRCWRVQRCLRDQPASPEAAVCLGLEHTAYVPRLRLWVGEETRRRWTLRREQLPLPEALEWLRAWTERLERLSVLEQERTQREQLQEHRERLRLAEQMRVWSARRTRPQRE